MVREEYVPHNLYCKRPGAHSQHVQMIGSDDAVIDGNLVGGVDTSNGLTILAGGLVVDNAGVTVSSGGVAVDTLGASISSHASDNEVLHVTASSGSFGSSTSVVKASTATVGAGTFDLLTALSTNSSEVFAVRANGLLAVPFGMHTTGGGVNVKGGGLRVTSGGVAVTDGGGHITNDAVATSPALVISASDGTNSYGGDVLVGQTTRAAGTAFNMLTLQVVRTWRAV